MKLSPQEVSDQMTLYSTGNGKVILNDDTIAATLYGHRISGHGQQAMVEAIKCGRITIEPRDTLLRPRCEMLKLHHPGGSMAKNTKGTEALDGKKEPAESKSKAPAKKEAKSKTKHKAPKRIITTRLDDNTFHHEHHMDDGSMAEYSSASPDDAGDHVAQQMGGGGAMAGGAGNDGEPEEAEEDAQEE